MDTSDAAAYRLLERIARKAVEPISDDADPNKTLGQCRNELLALIREAVSFVMARNSISKSDAHQLPVAQAQSNSNWDDMPHELSKIMSKPEQFKPEE